MTLDSKLSKAVYQGNGSTTVFPFAFKVWDASQIAVTVTDAAGVSTDVTSNSTVTFTSSGGSVAYPKSGSPLPGGAKLAITRNMPFTQGINLTTASRFDPQVLEDGLDQATAERQQMLEQMARAVILPATSRESPEDVVASIYASRDAAAASASAASTQATAAEGSAQAAANSASTAAQTVTTATADAVSAATAQANAAHDSALAAAQSAAAAAGASSGLAPRLDAVEAVTGPATALKNGVGRPDNTTITIDASGKYTARPFLLGEFYYFRHPSLRTGFAPCQGGILANAVTQYPELWAYLQTVEGKLLLKTEAEWQAMSTATWATLADGTKVGWNGIGGVPYYVQDLATGTLRLPDLRGMYAEAAGFDSLGVGGVHGDIMRKLVGNAGSVYNAGMTGAFATGASAGSFSTYSASVTFYQSLLDTSRVVPTGPVNAPKGWGALACCYLGRPA